MILKEDRRWNNTTKRKTSKSKGMIPEFDDLVLVVGVIIAASVIIYRFAINSDLARVVLGIGIGF